MASDNNHSRILVLFAHPAIQKSRVNAELIKPLQNIDGITFRDLYETYPDFYIDIKKEQALLLEHDIIIFMHPFYWYSIPSILKEWLDLVLEYGFAYGETGTALKGKKLLSVITTGGGNNSYHETGMNRFTIKQLLTPLNQTAHLCGMQYLPPFVVHNVLELTKEDIANHAIKLKEILLALRDGKVDLSQTEMTYLNMAIIK